MKLLRYGPRGAERPGLLDTDGSIRDLSVLLDDITPRQLSPAALRALASIDPSALPRVEGAPRIGPPVSGVGQLIAIGLNYSDHAEEAGLPRPDEPVVFLKAISSIAGPNDDVCLPSGSAKTDWEVELGIVMGSEARNVPEPDAASAIAGYLVANDISERAFQLERGGTWDKGKGCEGYGPLGPWLVTRDEVPDPQKLDMWLDVNGVRQQSGSTSSMIFGVHHLVSYVSQFIALKPGDVILTGTPAGVALGQKSPAYLKHGDVVTLGITGLGEQRQRIVGSEAS